MHKKKNLRSSSFISRVRRMGESSVRRLKDSGGGQARDAIKDGRTGGEQQHRKNTGSRPVWQISQRRLSGEGLGKRGK